MALRIVFLTLSGVLMLSPDWHSKSLLYIICIIISLQSDQKYKMNDWILDLKFM